MRKLISILLCVFLVSSCLFAFVGCAKKEQSFEIVMITDGSTIKDGGYNESAWNGIEAFASENDKTCRYYQPKTEDDGTLSTQTVKNYIDLAVKGGAKSIVLPGESFATPILELAKKYKDINFILVDAFAHKANDTNPVIIDNVMTIDFDVLQAGFLAGYTSVALGNTKLGFFGSVSNTKSPYYGAGYVQGAGYAADESGIPVYLDYAEYDAENLDYDYSVTIRPVYKKASISKEKTFKVKVVNGIGTGVYTDGENVTITASPAPAGKTFDHWECKSNTEGVKDKKVNISSKKNSTMNLLVGDCDCTITAVWKDAKTYPITIGDTVINAPADSTAWVTAPPAESGMIFDHWECKDESVIEDVKAPATNVTVTNKAITLTPVYVKSDAPTFNITVEDGTGSGSYRTGDHVEIVANPPKDGYMFYKWENVDNKGLSTGIAMENEYCYITNFDMVDRYASIAEMMYDNGTQVIFGGGNSQSDSIFTATNSFDYQVYAFGYGTDQNGMGNCLASVVNDYGAAVKLALKDFKGGTNLTGNCKNGCIYVTNTDDNKKCKKVFDALSKDKIDIYAPTSDVRELAKSKCLSLNYWVK